MKKYMLIGLGCLAFAGSGSLSETQAGVQVSVNLGGHGYYQERHYQRPHRNYYRDYCYEEPVYYCPPPVYRRPVVVYSRPPAYYNRRPVYPSYHSSYGCR
jgi:hypothetical protein